MTRIILLLTWMLVFLGSAFAEDEAKKAITLRTGSYVEHIFDRDQNYTEGLNNEFFALGVGVGDSSEIIVGTLKNSYDNRCAFIGYGKEWYRFNDKISFEGIYAYVGELFADQFSHCGKDGIYNTFSEKVGVGFAPYVYHGIRYHFTSYFSVETGVVLPELAVASIVWEF